MELLSDTPDGEVGQLVISSSSRVVWPGFDRDVEMTIWTLVKPMDDDKRMQTIWKLKMKITLGLFHFQNLSEKYKGIKCWSNLSGNTYFS